MQLIDKLIQLLKNIGYEDKSDSMMDIYHYVYDNQNITSTFSSIIIYNNNNNNNIKIELYYSSEYYISPYTKEDFDIIEYSDTTENIIDAIKYIKTVFKHNLRKKKLSLLLK